MENLLKPKYLYLSYKSSIYQIPREPDYLQKQLQISLNSAIYFFFFFLQNISRIYQNQIIYIYHIKVPFIKFHIIKPIENNKTVNRLLEKTIEIGDLIEFSHLFFFFFFYKIFSRIYQNEIIYIYHIKVPFIKFESKPITYKNNWRSYLAQPFIFFFFFYKIFSRIYQNQIIYIYYIKIQFIKFHVKH